MGNRNEIDISRFAADHSQNSKVKNFAQQMVKDHTNFINKLQQTISMSAAVQTPGGMPAGSAMPGQAMLPSQRTFAQPGQPRAGTFGGRPSAEALPQSRMAGYPPSSAAGSDAEVVQLLQQWRSQFEPMLRSELERNRGANFDKAYLGQQIIEHISMLAALRASESQASPQLQPLITQAIQTTQQHLDQARSLMSQLESTPNQK